MSKEKRPWGGRFRKATHPLMVKFSESLSFDRRLAQADVRGSIAHAHMLGRQKIIPNADVNKIVRGLREIAKELDSGKFPFQEALEDIHMNIEARLIEKIGAAGQKLHTGRSRNDQVALDLRLWVRDEIDSIRSLIRQLAGALVGQAEKNLSLIIPGYTHMQRAQPVSMAQHLMAYVEMLDRDNARFFDALKRVNVMPLGAGALAGSTLPLDPEAVARELGFDAVSRNSMDAVSDRDFVIESIFDAALCQTHLSRLAEELVLWSGDEFGYVELPEDFSTGSSLMPQKKNPDAAELTRGKTGRVIGDLMAMFTVMKGLPLTYNRDMQEDKEALFDAADTLRICLEVMTQVICGLKFNAGACERAMESDYLLATDVAEYLVMKGVPFRAAHEIVGRIVRLAMGRRKPLRELSIGDYRGFSGQFSDDVYKLFDPVRSVSARSTPGGPSPKRVGAEIRRWKQKNL